MEKLPLGNYIWNEMWSMCQCSWEVEYKEYNRCGDDIWEVPLEGGSLEEGYGHGVWMNAELTEG